MIASGQVAASVLELRGLEVGSDGSVTGTVVNGSGVAIKDVELRWVTSRPGATSTILATTIRAARAPSA